MITAVALAAYAALAGAVVPVLLARVRWAHRVPAAAVLAWQGLMATFVIAAALAVYHFVLTEHHVHDGLAGLLSACGLTDPLTGDAPPTLGHALKLAGPAVIVLMPVGWLVRCAWRDRRVRRRQLDTLALVGQPAPQYGATVVDHGIPAVYCLPGRRSRVVVTRGALEVLSDGQLRAVLEHERAHIVGRHHLLRLPTDAFCRAFRGLPLARHAKEQTELLLELIADDRALRFHPRETLATAMYEVAAGQVPQTALGAGGSSALIRLRRVLTPQPRPHRATWPGVVTAAVMAPLLPLLLACGL
ncbi:M56 family metallopeptidase [Streptomyces sp. ME02-8801-2C]|uniref:M56 family metallopeptidase n=1 Tax=Streptomyces sp. ME02-8801-2C TaxID=3028680 RepID=UPI0029B1AF71|nr:M56 family metallopeptidase [Streptomyces sp. ME02-8801-2C]MDX3458653.1 M56 family metallopeptidase [Streptomyces sp. ME02-8801-2C]